MDNKAGVMFQNNMSPNSKLKGVFDMRLGWLKELHDKKKWKAVKITTAVNLADELTKPLAPVIKKNLDLELERVKARVASSLGGK